MKKVLWLVLLMPIIARGQIVLDTAFVQDKQPMIFPKIFLGTVALYASVLDSFPLVESLIKDNLDTNFYLQKADGYYDNRIGAIEGKIKILSRRAGYLELYSQGGTKIWGIIPVEGRAVIKYYYTQISDSTVLNYVELYFASDNVLVWLSRPIKDIVYLTGKKLMDYVERLGAKLYQQKKLIK